MERKWLKPGISPSRTGCTRAKPKIGPQHTGQRERHNIEIQKSSNTYANRSVAIMNVYPPNRRRHIEQEPCRIQKPRTVCHKAQGGHEDTGTRKGADDPPVTGWIVPGRTDAQKHRDQA